MKHFIQTLVLFIALGCIGCQPALADQTTVSPAGAGAGDLSAKLDKPSDPLDAGKFPRVNAAGDDFDYVDTTHFKDSQVLAGIIDGDSLLADMAESQAFHFHTSGLVTFSSANNIVTMVDGNLTPVGNSVAIANGVQGYISKDGGGNLSVVYTTSIDPHAADFGSGSGTVDADVLLANMEVGQAFNFQALFGDATFTSALSMGTLIDADALGGNVTVTIPAGTKAQLIKNAAGEINVSYNTKPAEITSLDETVDVNQTDLSINGCAINDYVHTINDFHLDIAHEGAGGTFLTVNVNGVDATYDNLLNATDAGAGQVTFSGGANGNYNRLASTVESIRKVGDYFEITKPATGQFDTQQIAFSTIPGDALANWGGKYRFIFSGSAITLRDPLGNDVYTNGTEQGTYKVTRTLAGFKVERDDVEVYQTQTDCVSYQEEDEHHNPLWLYFTENYPTTGSVDIENHVDSIGVGVKLQDTAAVNSFIDGVNFTVPDSTYRIRFEIKKETNNKNLYMDLRRVSDNSLNRFNINATTGNSTIQSGTTSVIDNGNTWLVEGVYNTVAGQDYKQVILPDFGAGLDSNTFYSFEPFARQDFHNDTSDVTKQLRTFERRNNTTTVPVDVEDFQGIPLTRLTDDTTGTWSIYTTTQDIPQRGQVQHVRIVWRVDPLDTRYAALRLSLTGVTIDTLFNKATGDVVEKNGGQTEIISNKPFSDGLQETIIQFNTTRNDLTTWTIFPAYSNNNTTGAQAGVIGAFDIAVLDFNYDYQPEERFVSRHKIVATADNTGGQLAGNDSFVIDTPSTVETSPIITDNGDNTYTVTAGQYPVEIVADYKTTSLSGQVAERIYYINDTATATTVRMPKSIDGEFGQLNIQTPAYAIVEPNTTVTVRVRSASSGGNQVMVEGSSLTFTELFR